MYLEKVYIAGDTVEIEKGYSSQYGKKGTKRKRFRPTPETMKRYNEKKAEDELRRTINANFRYGDYHLVLTYLREKRPEGGQEKKLLAQFLRRARSAYRKVGMELKYIAVTEYGKGAVHHHLIVNRIDAMVFSELWPYGRPHVTLLDSTGNYAGLAHYFVKEATLSATGKSLCGKKRWTSSKNLKKVEPEVTVIRAQGWKPAFVPKRFSRDYILDTDSVREGVSEITGYPYQFFRLIRFAKGGGRCGS